MELMSFTRLTVEIEQQQQLPNSNSRCYTLLCRRTPIPKSSNRAANAKLQFQLENFIRILVSNPSHPKKAPIAHQMNVSSKLDSCRIRVIPAKVQAPPTTSEDVDSLHGACLTRKATPPLLLFMQGRIPGNYPPAS